MRRRWRQQKVVVGEDKEEQGEEKKMRNEG